MRFTRMRILRNPERMSKLFVISEMDDFILRRKFYGLFFADVELIIILLLASNLFQLFYSNSKIISIIILIIVNFIFDKT